MRKWPDLDPRSTFQTGAHKNPLYSLWQQYPDLENVSFCNHNLSYQPLSHIHILNLHRLYFKWQDLFLMCLSHNLSNSLYNSELGQTTGDERKAAPEKRETSSSALPRPSPCYRKPPCSWNKEISLSTSLSANKWEFHPFEVKALGVNVHVWQYKLPMTCVLTRKARSNNAIQ